MTVLVTSEGVVHLHVLCFLISFNVCVCVCVCVCVFGD